MQSYSKMLKCPKRYIANLHNIVGCVIIIIYQDLPKAREYIHYDGHEITGTDEIEKVLRQIRYKSIFYKQNNPDFYNHIVKQVQDFEDYLVMTKEIKDNDRFIVYHKKVDEYIANLCDSIFKCYQGR